MENTRDKIEMLIPEYLSGDLSAEEIAFLEKNIIDFPDLAKELEEMRAVWRNMGKADLESGYLKASRNISYKVMERLEARPARPFGRRFAFALPALAAIAIAYFLILPGNPGAAGGSVPIIGSAEVEGIFGEAGGDAPIEPALVREVAKSDFIAITEDEYAGLYEEMLLGDDPGQLESLFIDERFHAGQEEIIDQLSNFTDEELNEILTEEENVKSNS